MAKKNLGIVRPILTRWCKDCGRIFCASHPKSPEELCEQCREKAKNKEKTCAS